MKCAMANTPSPSNQRGVPEGFVAIPVGESELTSTLRLCVVVRRTPDPTNGHFVVHEQPQHVCLDRLHRHQRQLQ